jgi:hypothetical protein
MPWEGVEIKLEAVDGLVGAEVEEGCIWVNGPLLVRHLSRAVVVGPVVADEIHVGEFLHFGVVLVGPHTGHHKVARSLWLETDEVFDDSSVLHGGSTLLEHDPIVVWNLEELSDLILAVV